MAETVYGFDESKSKVEVPDKATYDADISALESGKVDKSTQSAKDSEQDTSIATAQSTAEGKQDPIVAGTGISIGSDGKTINHSNSITAKTSYVGSATAVPRFKFDAQGHITGVTTATIYPPTTPGEEGQVWMSDGSGAGSWQTPTSGKKELYTGTLASLITATSTTTFTINQEFDIEYLYWSKSGSSDSYSELWVMRTTISKGTYTVSGKVTLGKQMANSSIELYIHRPYNSKTFSVKMGTFSTVTQLTSETLSFSSGAGYYRLYV